MTKQSPCDETRPRPRRRSAPSDGAAGACQAGYSGAFRLVESRQHREEMMKRSRVNEILRESDAFIRSFGYVMPPFAYWSPDELKQREARRHTRCAPGLGHHRLRPGEVRRARPFPLHRAQRPGRGSQARHRHALCREDHDLAQGPVVADAPACGEGGRHHQPRRRQAGAGAVHAGARRRHRPPGRGRGADRRRHPQAAGRRRCSSSIPARASRCFPASGTPSGARAPTC